MSRTLTRDEFFGSVSSNLKHLAEAPVAFVPYHRLSFVWKLAASSRVVRGAQVIWINSSGRSADENLRVYDIVSKPLPGTRPLRLRVMAYYVEGEPTQKTYGEAKRKILTWHDRRTDNGRAPNEKFTVGAVVIGAGAPWSDDLHIDADGLPDGVDYQLLAAPSHHKERRRYDVTRWLGDKDESLPIFRALEPEPFESRWERVKAVVDNWPEGEYLPHDLAERTETDEEDVKNMFHDFQARGLLLLDKEDHAKRCKLGNLKYRRLMAQSREFSKGRWYAQHSSRSMLWLRLTLGGILPTVLYWVLKQILPDYLSEHIWLLGLFAGAALLCAFVIGLRVFFGANKD